MKLESEKPLRLTNRGVVLVITLTMVVLLVAMVFEVNRRVRLGVDAAQLFRDRIQLSYMASSGINVARALLIKDKRNSEVDSIQEEWANSSALQTIVDQFSFPQGGRVTVTITDVLGKIQVNALVDYPNGSAFNETQKVLWYQLLQAVRLRREGENDIKPLAIIHSVKDWLDYGDDEAITGLEGAESDYYQGLIPPYSCRNGPIIDISELVLVKGIDPDIFQAAETSYGISDFLTSFGMTEAQGPGDYTYPGRININTASLFVLSALLPLEDMSCGADLHAYREEMSDGNYVHDLSDENWYKRVPGCEEVRIPADLITTRSDFFEISVTAEFNDTQLTRKVVVHRETEKESGQWRCRIIMTQG